MLTLEQHVQQLKDELDRSRFTVAITGAGISTSAGILDMEHMNVAKVMQTSVEALVRLHPERSYRLLRKSFLDPMFINGPTLTHRTLATMERQGRLHGIITTNIDHLHSLAGSQHVAELQGSYGVNRCARCKKQHDDIRVWDTGKAPRCSVCGGVLLAFPVYTNVGLSLPDYNRSADWVARADLVIIAGSKGMYGQYMHDLNPRARVVQINPKPTRFDESATLTIRSNADSVFDAL